MKNPDSAPFFYKATMGEKLYSTVEEEKCMESLKYSGLKNPPLEPMISNIMLILKLFIYSYFIHEHYIMDSII